MYLSLDNYPPYDNCCYREGDDDDDARSRNQRVAYVCVKDLDVVLVSFFLQTILFNSLFLLRFLLPVSSRERWSLRPLSPNLFSFSFQTFSQKPKAACCEGAFRNDA